MFLAMVFFRGAMLEGILWIPESSPCQGGPVKN